MYKQLICRSLLLLCLAAMGCKAPSVVLRDARKSTPAHYGQGADSSNSAALPWRSFFADPDLVRLIDTALKNNQELLIALQEIEIARSEARLRQGPLLPKVRARVGAGLEKVGRYTSQGAGDAATEIKPGEEMPETLTDITAAAYASWEVDIWKKLRNARKASIARYLATMEGRNFVRTNLVAEVARSYYELLALDNQLDIVQQSIALQQNALELVQVQKEASRVTELAVQKFSAELLKSQSLAYDIRQRVQETENRINFLLGRYPQAVPRAKGQFMTLGPPVLQAGVPSQLLANRPDIRQAELALEAAKLDVKVARAEFYPSFELSAALGFQAFKPAYLLKAPESILYSLAGDLAGPLVNRAAIKAEFYGATARQLQALYQYERSILNACIEVSTELSRISNLKGRYELRVRQVAALDRSTGIASDLFRSARADYLEVLMTQRDVLEARLELVETRKEQLNAAVQVYRNLGGGWQ